MDSLRKASDVVEIVQVVNLQQKPPKTRPRRLIKSCPNQALISLTSAL